MTLHWKKEKELALSRLRRDYELGKVDSDIKGLLDIINAMNCYYTTSSCSGRIQIAEVKYPWMKREFRVLGKWHRPITTDEALGCISKGKENVWLSVEPPILHIVAKDLEAAKRMLIIVRQCGFKHSGIQGLRDKRILIEVLSTEKMEVPLIHDGKWLIRINEIAYLVDLANLFLVRGKSRLNRLKGRLKSLQRAMEA